MVTNLTACNMAVRVHGGDLNPISSSFVREGKGTEHRDATRLHGAFCSRVVSRTPSCSLQPGLLAAFPIGPFGVFLALPRNSGSLMVVRDKLENSGGLAWRRLEQGQLPELPCIGPALAAAEADPWHGAATCPCPVLALGISFTSPLDAGIHRLPYSFCWRRSSNPLHDCVL